MAHFLLYDIPDEDQLIHQYLDEIRHTHSPVSADILLEHMKDVANEGRFITGCKPVGDDLWALDVPIGYGDIARILFFEVKNGDYLAVHGFTKGDEMSAQEGLAVAVRRKRDLM